MTTVNLGEKSISSESDSMARPESTYGDGTCVTCVYYRQYGNNVPGQETRDCCGWGHNCDSKSYCKSCRPRNVNHWTEACSRYIDRK